MTTLQIPSARPRRTGLWVAIIAALLAVAGLMALALGGGGGGKSAAGAGKSAAARADGGAPGVAGSGGGALARTATGSAPSIPAPAPWVPKGIRPLDLHADTPYQQIKKGPFAVDKQLPFGDMDVPRLRAGHYLGQFWVIWVPPKESDFAEFAEKSWAALEHMVDSSGGALEIATTPDEIRKLDAAGKLAIVPCMEGAHPLMGDPEKLRAWAARGVRYLGITWNNSNDFGDAAADEHPPNGGLSAKGLKLVRLAEQLGVAIDVSHAAASTFWDVYVAGEVPFLASHSDSRALHDHYRNLDDLQLWAVADAGGVVGANYHSVFLGPAKHADIPTVVAHIEHMRRVMGIDHVALGSDFDGLIIKPSGLGDVSHVPDLLDALAKNGWSEAELAKLASGNALRVLGDVVAKKKRPHPPLLAPIDVKDATGEAEPGHTAVLAIDRDVRTAWVPPQANPGELLELSVPNLADVGGLVVVGHDEHELSRRVKTLEVSLFDAEGAAVGPTRRVTLADDLHPQSVILPAPAGVKTGRGTVRVAIVDGYAGDGRLGLAEVAPMRRANGP